jgi:hypothetical protein
MTLLDSHVNGAPMLFSLYHYVWESTETDFYFIGNKGSDGYLVPEMREADYFIMIGIILMMMTWKT